MRRSLLSLFLISLSMACDEATPIMEPSDPDPGRLYRADGFSPIGENQPCQPATELLPVPPDEFFFWFAARIDVPTGDGPFPVRRLRYQIDGMSSQPDVFQCDSNLPHRVVLMTAPVASTAPPRNAERVIEAPLEVGDPAYKEIEIAVDPPVVVEPGETLYVGIEAPGIGDRLICITSCPQVGQLAETHSFFSRTTSIADGWVRMSDFDLNVVLLPSVDSGE